MQRLEQKNKGLSRRLSFSFLGHMDDFVKSVLQQLRRSRVKKKFFKIGPWPPKFQKRLVCLNFFSVAQLYCSCIAHCVAHCIAEVAECCKVWQGVCRDMQCCHSLPQDASSPVWTVALRGRLCHAVGCKHNTEPCLDQTTFASLGILASVFFFFMACAANCPSRIKISERPHHTFTLCRSFCLSNSAALLQLNIKKHMHTLGPTVR